MKLILEIVQKSAECCRGTGFNYKIQSVLVVLLGLLVVWPDFAHAKSSKYAAMVVDGHTGRVLFSRNAKDLRYPASLTKIMTLYMLFGELKSGKLNLQSKLVVSDYAASQAPSKINVKSGSTITVETAIKSLVTKSANDVAVVVAENLGGTERKFARMMTVKAHKIGMTDSHFRNASGLPDRKQVTSARDMAILGRRVRQDFPRYFRYFKTKTFTYKGKRHRNHNSLLFNYRGTDGIKTGYTRWSGFNLLATVKRGNKHLIGVVLGGKSARKRDAHMRYILNKSIGKAVARKPSRRPVRKKLATRRAPKKVQTAIPAPIRKPATNQQVVAAEQSPTKQITDRIQPTNANAVLPQPKPTESSVWPGPYHIQVGAYTSLTEAQARLITVYSEAKSLLKGHKPFTMRIPQGQREIYRARFSAFSEKKARSTCYRLKRKKINCIALSAE